MGTALHFLMLACKHHVQRQQGGLQGVLDLVAAELEQEEELRAQHARDKKQVGCVSSKIPPPSNWARYTVVRVSLRHISVCELSCLQLA